MSATAEAEPQVLTAQQTRDAIAAGWEALGADRVVMCEQYAADPTAAVSDQIAATEDDEDATLDAVVLRSFFDEMCPAVLTTPEVADPPTPAPSLWSRYGLLPAGFGSNMADQDFALAGADFCAKVSNGTTGDLYLPGLITGGTDQVKPQPMYVWMLWRSMQVSCPDLLPQYVALMDAYDAAHAPYPY